MRPTAPSQPPPRRRRKERQPPTSQLSDLPLDHTPGAPPLYQQIRDQVRYMVLSGELGAGMRLPPERELAVALGVNRTTVTRAYQELVADGIVEARHGHGTVISPLPAQLRESTYGMPVTGAAPVASWLVGLRALGPRMGSDPGLLRDALAASLRDDVISFAAGAPTADLIPYTDLQYALREGLLRHGAEALGYGPVEGLEGLRAAIAGRLCRRGMAVGPEEVLVTSGGTQGVALAAHALIEPGDEVVVEAPTYVGALQAFSAAGAQLIGVPVDARGMRIDLLAPILARRRVRLIFVQPTLHNPTGATLSLERRERLVALARRHSVPVLEDDAYGELWSEGEAPLPLMAIDRGGVVLHLGTFSKTAAPGLRVGWLAGPAPVLTRLALIKQLLDLNTGALPQLTLENFLAGDQYDRHLARIRRIYAERRAVVRTGLEGAGEIFELAPETGGFYLWCRLRGQHSARLLVAAAARSGVAILGGDAFYPPFSLGTDDGHDQIRLSVAGATPPMIATGLRLLAQAAATLGEPARHVQGPRAGLRPVG
jgi:DNA-binding transcriptional MocR family regulator